MRTKIGMKPKAEDFQRMQRLVSQEVESVASLNKQLQRRVEEEKLDPRSKMKCNTTIVLDVKTSETSGVAYEKISSIAI